MVSCFTVLPVSDEPPQPASTRAVTKRRSARASMKSDHYAGLTEEMELGGLEPPTSWVRCGELQCDAWPHSWLDRAISPSRLCDGMTTRYPWMSVPVAGFGH